MLEETMIQTRGFRNVNGGFAVRLRLPYYRGLWTSLIEGVALEVDGEQFAPDQLIWTIGETSYTLGELTSSASGRWPVDVPATIQAPREEPLSIGFHDVSADLRLRMSYIPEELQPTIWTEIRRMVITK